ncbi:MAG: hypothetical protein ACAH89_11155 [Rariglobus sp.]|nr:hypothetical protein [Rariglobus sp.]
MNNDKPAPGLPDDFEERIRRAYDDKPPRSFARSAAINFLMIAGGLSVVGVIVVPGTTMGASRTGRLEWQRREAEIARVIEAASTVERPEQP